MARLIVMFLLLFSSFAWIGFVMDLMQASRERFKEKSMIFLDRSFDEGQYSINESFSKNLSSGYYIFAAQIDANASNGKLTIYTDRTTAIYNIRGNRFQIIIIYEFDHQLEMKVELSLRIVSTSHAHVTLFLYKANSLGEIKSILNELVSVIPSILIAIFEAVIAVLVFPAMIYRYFKDKKESLSQATEATYVGWTLLRDIIFFFVHLFLCVALMIANLFANLGSIEDSPSPYIVHLNTVDIMEVFLFNPYVILVLILSILGMVLSFSKVFIAKLDGKIAIIYDNKICICREHIEIIELSGNKVIIRVGNMKMEIRGFRREVLNNFVDKQ